MKKIYIRTFGCQMNDRDSEALLGLFLEKGYSVSANPEDADVILINTCSVREHAEDRAISFAGTLKRLTEGRRKKDEGRKPVPRPSSLIPRKVVIGVIGCMARNRGEELAKRMSHIDLICGPAAFAKIPAYVEAIRSEGRGTKDEGRKRIIDLEDGLRDEEMYRAAFRMEPDHAQVVISTGCSNFCSYCVVPYVRGELRLRKPEDIIDEVKRNISLGIKKITLLGQNVNDYLYRLPLTANRLPFDGTRYACLPAGRVHGTRNISFVELLKMVDNIEGIEELSFITSQPRNTSIELFEVMAKSPRIKKHLHLPFQSGSNRILEMMNRGYTREQYLQLSQNYKKIVGGTLSTDVIVGFPTETDKDFLQTKDILERVRFRYAYIFKYSPRLRAKSAKLDDDVPEDVKAKRHKILLDLQKQISLSEG
jgi:tRNA-2-methylthio-N6-dimethylallyladenosine synthase